MHSSCKFALSFNQFCKLNDEASVTISSYVRIDLGAVSPGVQLIPVIIDTIRHLKVRNLREVSELLFRRILVRQPLLVGSKYLFSMSKKNRKVLIFLALDMRASEIAA
jgi:hypothetical protein